MSTPLTPANCDLRDFPRMMVDVPRLLGSEFNALASRTPIAWMVGHKLWYRAWHQVPAASLPSDDDQLCHLAELGFDLKTWRKAKPVALRGWEMCSDGRLYHPVVAEAALEAWIEKLLQRLSSGAGNAKRYKHDFDPAPINAMVDEAAGLLANLNPRSRAADKLKRRQSRTPPDDLPPGEPVGSPPAFPPGSQETGTGRIEERIDANASVVSAKPKPTPDGVKAAFDAWNDLAKRAGLPTARTLDAGRRKLIHARLADGGLPAWSEALQAVESSPHCLGQNDRGWRADLDFVCTASKFRRLIEGAYRGADNILTLPTAHSGNDHGQPDHARSAKAIARHGNYARSDSGFESAAGRWRE